MIIITVLLAIILLLDDQATAQKDLISKFHQTDYKIRNLRIETVTVNYSFVEIFEIKSYKFNRTTTAFNLTIQSKIDLNNTTELLVQAYRFASNEYRYFPMRFQLNLCAAYQNNVIGMYNWTGNFNPCSIKKDTVYHTYNFVVDGSQLPPLIPNGEYKLKFVFMKNEDQIGVFYAYVEAHRPYGMKKNN